MRVKNLFTISSAAAIAVGLLSVSVGAAVTTINFWHGITAADGQYLTDLCKKFEKEHKGQYKIQQQTAGWAQLFEKVIVGLAANKPPQVFIVHPEEYYWFQRSNAFRSLNEFVNGPKGIPKDDRVPSAWKVVESGSKIFGVPLDNHNFNMYYNTELFALSGLDPNSPPETGVEFLEAAKKITRMKSDGKTYDKMGYVYTWSRTTYLSLLAQFGGQLLSNDQTKATFNTEAGIQALTAMQDWRNRYRIGDWGGVDVFTARRAGMAFEGPWWVGSMLKAQVKGLKWAPAPIPTFGKEKACWTSGHIMFIPPNIKGKQLDAAWTFVKWMSDHSNEWAVAGQIPVRKRHLNTAEFRALPVQSTFAKMLPYAYFEPSVRKQAEFRAIYEPMIDNAVNNKGETKVLLDKAADQVNRLLATIKK